MLQYIVKTKKKNRTIYNLLKEGGRYSPGKLSRNINSFVIVTDMNGFFSIQEGSMQNYVLLITDKESDVDEFIQEMIKSQNIINGEDHKIVNSGNIIELTSDFSDIYTIYHGINNEHISFNEIEDFQETLPELINKIHSKINDFNDLFIIPFIEEYKKKKPNANMKIALINYIEASLRCFLVIPLSSRTKRLLI